MIDSPFKYHGTNEEAEDDFMIGKCATRHLSLRDVQDWEVRYGPIPEGALIIYRTGWSHFYHHLDKFFGHFDGKTNPKFPGKFCDIRIDPFDQLMDCKLKDNQSLSGFALDAAQFLIKDRSISGFATEAFDIENPSVTDNGVKKLLSSNNKFSVVQLNSNVHHLPGRQFTVTLAPLKLRGGSGGPTRVYAIIKAP